MEFFGGVEAAWVGEGGGEVVGSFGERRGEEEEGDGDDGVFNSGGGEDSAVEVEAGGRGGGGGTNGQYLFSSSCKCLRAGRWRQRWPVHQLSCCILGSGPATGVKLGERSFWEDVEEGGGRGRGEGEKDRGGRGGEITKSTPTTSLLWQSRPNQGTSQGSPFI